MRALSRFLYSLILSCFLTKGVEIKLIRANQTKDNNINFTVKFRPTANEFVYRDNLTVSCDSPTCTIASWTTHPQPEELFDPAYKKTKKIFKKKFTISGTIACTNIDSCAQLVIGYETTQSSGPHLVFLPLESRQRIPQEKNIPVSQESTIKTPAPTPPFTPQTCPAPHAQTTSVSEHIQQLITTHSSWWLRIVLVILLGILMSLTPCIYPMIPITIGILHSNRQAPWWYHVARACCYTFGVALMFAFLGLAAAVTGSLFGSVLQQPLVILAVIIFLLYLAFSLFGWYELYIPRFFTVRKKDIKPSGSCVSAFVFGFASGTIASPCLSPGLAFLLSIVTALGNKILGFIILFAFGVGMSIPLILIGSFAPIINYLPAAGRWMAEIKKFFGVLLIALCFYFLSMIVPIIFVWWFVASTLFGTGVYALLSALLSKKNHAQRSVRIITGIIVLICAGIGYWYALQGTRIQSVRALITWHTDYTQAITRAQQEQRWVFIDFSAPYCSICKAIDRCIFNNATIAPLINAMVPVHIDVSSSPDYQILNMQYHIIGVPTILVIDPYSQAIKQRFGAELYSTSTDEIRDMFQELVAQLPVVQPQVAQPPRTKN